VVAGTFLSTVGQGDQARLSLEFDSPWPAYGLVALAGLAILWRRSRPLLVAGIEAAVAIVWDVLEYSGDPSLGLSVAAYSVGRYVADVRYSYATAVVVAVGGGIAGSVEPGSLAGAVFGAAWFWLPWYVGRRVLARDAYLVMLEERAVHLERERTTLAERAVADERAAIARELHDVVAHRVSMMTVQAGAAKTVGADEPERALEAVAAIEDEGRQALIELRHLLGVLRPDESGEAGTVPQGAFEQIPALVDRMREAGYEVEYELDFDPSTVPSRVGLSVYRVLQESLTNVVKHTGVDTSVRIRIAVDDGTLEAVVADNGTALSALPDSGFGLAGMRERMALLGGSLEAGPKPGGGWQVRARIPMEDWQ
jgi:signal transduction histidine kinase